MPDPSALLAQRGRRLILLLVLALSLFLRLWRIDVFSTVDEHRWRTRSIDFARALATGDYARTAQTEHPGVTAMWAGAAAHSIATQLEAADIRAPWLRAMLYPRGYDAGTGLYLETVWARRLIALINWLGVVGLYLLGRRFLPPLANLLATLFVALDPFYLGYARLHHLDGLLTCFVALSIWALLAYGERRRRADLLLSGAFAALAVLTKAPGILLAPGMVVIRGAYGWSRRLSEPHWARRWLADALLWSGVALAVVVALWPALWVAPLDTLRMVLEGVSSQVGNPHATGNYFWGMERADPGPFYYPVAWALRTTPPVMVGLLLLPWGRRQRALRAHRYALLFALLYAGALTLSLKKGDRYLLPVFPLLSLPAALGWDWLVQRVQQRWRWAWPGPALGGASVALYAVLLAPAAPYYTAYYNPLAGGVAAGKHAMLVGWGEGLEQAAEYLNDQPNAEALRVAAMRSQDFALFFVGHTSDIDELHPALPDYYVTYASHVQRGYAPELLEALQDSEPEFVAQAGNGLVWAWVYANPVLAREQRAILRKVSADPGGGLLLLSALPAAVKRSDLAIETLVARRRDQLLTELAWRAGDHDAVWLLSIAGLDQQATATLRATLDEIATVTDHEQHGEVTAWRYELALSPLSPPTGEQARECTLGEAISLRGRRLRAETAVPGGSLELSLYWQAQAAPPGDYTVFVHLVGADEAILTQSDGQPQGGLRPTSTWRVGEWILDEHVLSLPAEAEPGRYSLYVGLYDAETLQRLPIHDETGARLPDDRLPLGAIEVLP